MNAAPHMLSQSVVALALVGALLALWYHVKVSTGDTATGTNRRRSPRHPLVLSLQVAGNGNASTGLTHDVSLLGCRINSDLPAKPGQRVAVHLHPPGEAPIVIETATIRWAKEEEFGVQFVALRPEHRQRLRRLLDAVRTGA
ncbi:PilZ domain-containing protein [Candidatus Nitrospira bockiana]